MFRGIGGNDFVRIFWDIHKVKAQIKNVSAAALEIGRKKRAVSIKSSGDKAKDILKNLRVFTKNYINFRIIITYCSCGIFLY